MMKDDFIEDEYEDDFKQSVLDEADIPIPSEQPLSDHVVEEEDLILDETLEVQSEPKQVTSLSNRRGATTDNAAPYNSHAHQIGQSPRRKRIIIKGDTSIQQVPPISGRAQSSSRRRPPTGERRQRNDLISTTLHNKAKKIGQQQSRTVNIDASQQRSPHKRNLPDYQHVSYTSEVVMGTQEDEEEDNFYDKLFDQMQAGLENPELSTTALDHGAIMREMAEKMRREIAQRYAGDATQIIEKHQAKQTQIADEKANLVIKQGYLKSLMSNLETKADCLLSSMQSTPPIVDQSWRLVQNWLFSLITDQEKCVRYARVKACQQITHAQAQKLKYQEGKVNQVFQLLSKMKQFPMVKVNIQQKPLKPLKADVLEYLKQRFGNAHFEHMGTMRGKPNLKFQAKGAASRKYLHFNSDGHKLPSLTLLFRDADRIIQANSDLLHIECAKIKLDPSQMDTQQLILNDVLAPFQEPDVTSRREMRVFVCAKEAKEHKKVENLRQFQEMLESQDEDGWCFQVESDVPLCQIKRLKNTNQLKVQPNDDMQFSILSECRLKHLLRSKVFERYFKRGDTLAEVEQLNNFYIIEENSLFHQQQNQGIINHQRKIRHFRRLSDFEVVLLLSRSLGHLTTSYSPQPIELKLSQEILKRIHNFEQTTQEVATQSPQQNQLSNEWLQANYVIVSCMEGTHVLKQYLVRFPRASNLTSPTDDAGFCHFSNCLQHISHSKKVEPPRHSQEVLTQSQTQLVALKKARPESANNRNLNQNLTHTVGARIQKRLTRLPLMLELEICESPLVKLLQKRFKQSIQPQVVQQSLNKDKSAKLIPQQIPAQIQTLDASQSKSPVSRSSFCQKHHELEQFISSKLNIALQPIQLRPTSFHKALKNFSNWREELKQSLCHDLYAKNAKGGHVMHENLNKIFSYCSQILQLGVQVDVSGFVEVVYQQQPQVINYLESYYSWIMKVSQLQKSIYQSNENYQEAREHYISQLKAFNLNIKQARENEQYLANELKRWLVSPHFQQTIQTTLGSVTFSQIVEIVRSKDVIFKFQQFQALAERINTGQLMTEAAQDGSMLPRIGETTGKNIGGGHQTHTAGFFKPGAEAFGSNKVIDKLTMIYGGGVPMQNSIQGSTGTNFMKKPDKLTSSSGFSESKQLNPIQRKFSAGTKKQEEYYSESPQTYKNLSKNDILLPPPVSNANQMSKQRANSAHKNNNNQALMKTSIQQPENVYNRPVTNISQYDNATNLPPASNKQYQAVAQTYQQPPPRFNQQMMPTSLIPIQNAYRNIHNNQRPVLAQGPPQANSLLLSQQQQQKQLKQNIIMHHHTQGASNSLNPQSTVSKASGGIIPSNTSIGFHNVQQLAQPSNPHRVSSAHGDKDRKRLIEGGGKHHKKGKKKSSQSSNGGKLGESANKTDQQ